PDTVLRGWIQKLYVRDSQAERIRLHKRIEKYLDQGYGESFLRNRTIAEMVQNDLLSLDGEKYRLAAWVIMPNHIHFLATRFERATLAGIMQSFKSLTSHK